jgi:single-stranded-DNA-specific exonuclease
VHELFTHFGGHEFACGFSLPARNLPELRRRLHDQFAVMNEAQFVREARVDATLTLSEVDGEFLAAHEMLQPFGAGNPQPLFLIENVEVTGTRTFAEDCCELKLQDGTGSAVGVLWPSAKDLAKDVGSGRVDLLVRVEPDRYHAIRLEVVDARRVTSSAAPA